MTALSPDHVFVQPRKEIHKSGEILKWLKSDAYNEYLSFLETLNESVKGKSLLHPVNCSPVVVSMLALLEKLDAQIEETPPIDQPQRFGNRAFTLWYQKLQERASDLLAEVLPENLHPALTEIPVYLIESFGNSTRIDYGTGHEMSFVMLLYCLFRIGALDNTSMDDRVAAVNKIFDRYMKLVRKLQQTYRMEPAGSHGVWSLDDFQFVPFIWGSSQLIANPKLDPVSFTDEVCVERAKEEYMFMACIHYILQVKTGPFYEHSNQLWNISGTSSWTKINQGLLKMYKAEVLAKFPVIQHTLFGSLLSIQPFDTSKGKPRLGFGPGAGLDGFRLVSQGSQDSDGYSRSPDGPLPRSLDGSIVRSPDCSLPRSFDSSFPRMSPDGSVPRSPGCALPKTPDGPIPKTPDGS